MPSSPSFSARQHPPPPLFDTTRSSFQLDSGRTRYVRLFPFILLVLQFISDITFSSLVSSDVWYLHPLPPSCRAFRGLRPPSPRPFLRTHGCDNTFYPFNTIEPSSHRPVREVFLSLETGVCKLFFSSVRTTTNRIPDMLFTSLKAVKP